MRAQVGALEGLRGDENGIEFFTAAATTAAATNWSSPLATTIAEANVEVARACSLATTTKLATTSVLASAANVEVASACSLATATAANISAAAAATTAANIENASAPIIKVVNTLAIMVAAIKVDIAANTNER